MEIKKKVFPKYNYGFSTAYWVRLSFMIRAALCDSKQNRSTLFLGLRCHVLQIEQLAPTGAEFDTSPKSNFLHYFCMKIKKK